MSDEHHGYSDRDTHLRATDCAECHASLAREGAAQVLDVEPGCTTFRHPVRPHPASDLVGLCESRLPDLFCACGTYLLLWRPHERPEQNRHAEPPASATLPLNEGCVVASGLGGPVNRVNQVLLTVTLVALLIVAGWYLSKETFISMLQLERRALIAENENQQLKAQLQAGRAPTPAPAKP